jgi:hypothetical protein
MWAMIVRWSQLVDVVFPDGTRVRGSSLDERREEDPFRDFGIYADPKWEPTWPAALIDWADFGVPANDEVAALQIEDAFEKASGGLFVEVGCRGGLGRTGTILSCMGVLAGIPAGDAVQWVRENYKPEAVEGPEQEAWVLWFAERRG